MKSQSRNLLIALGCALVVGAALSPFASSLPDGLEWALERLGVEHPEAAGGSLAAPMADYALPGIGSTYLRQALAGFIGVLAVFGAGYGLARALRRPTERDGSGE